MAKYTTTIRTLIENGYHLYLDNYPIFNENHRAALNQKIVEHFYFREIGFETAELFNFHLQRTMNEIMPYYNKLYQSELLENGINFLTDFNETETITKDSTEMYAGYSGGISRNYDKTAAGGSSKQVSNTNGLDYNIHSDTPQQQLQLDPDSLQYASDTDSTHTSGATANPEKHHTAQTHETATNNNNASGGDSEKSEDLTRSKSGKSPGKSYAELIEDYRKILLNVDLMIISELEPLFMLVY